MSRSKGTSSEVRRPKFYVCKHSDRRPPFIRSWRDLRDLVIASTVIGFIMSAYAVMTWFIVKG